MTAERQTAYRKRRRAAGEVPVQLWLTRETVDLLDGLKGPGEQRSGVVTRALAKLAAAVQTPAPPARELHQRRRQRNARAG